MNVISITHFIYTEALSKWWHMQGCRKYRVKDVCGCGLQLCIHVLPFNGLS